MSSSVIAQLRSQSSSVNLSALQQRDAHVSRVLFTAKHVVLYHLDHAQAWQRQDIEGPLFIVERRSAPFYQLVILNRKSMTDWRQALTAAMASAIETQDKHLFFQADNLVITLWFHEQPDCVKALEVMQRLCPIADQQPQQQTQQQQAQQPTVQQQTPPQPQQSQATKHSPSKPPSSDPQPPYQPVSSPQPSGGGPPPSAPIPKTYQSPYAPPPPVEYNVALPPSGQRNDRELQQRLQGFLSQFQQRDGEHTAAYQRELQEVEALKRDNIRRYQEEEKRKQEHERRIAAEEMRKKATVTGSVSASSGAAAPAPGSTATPATLASNQHYTLQQYPSAAPPAATAIAAASTDSSSAAGELERNLAAAKARKVARSQQQSQSQSHPPYPHPSEYSPSLAPSNPPPASTLPLSLLLAASQSASHPPMPVVSSSSPLLRPMPYGAASSPSASPILGPIRSSPPPSLLAQMQQQQHQQQATSAAPAAAAPSPEIHPLLAMLNRSVVSQGTALPPMPNIPSVQSGAGVPVPSPYAAARSPEPTPAAHQQTNASVLLTPSHFMPSAAAAAAAAPTLGVVAPVGPAPAQPMKLRTPSEFKDYLTFLCNDQATFDWLYQKYLANPQQHPFA